MGVTTLELDVGITRDGTVVVNHDRHVGRRVYRDTHPVVHGDALFPYAGRRIVDLTTAQIRSLRFLPARGYPKAHFDGAGDAGGNPAAGSRMPTLEEAFVLCGRYGAGQVQINIEAKLDPTRPHETVPPSRFAAVTLEAIQIYGDPGTSMLSSFDWRVLLSARSLLSGLPLVALVAHSRGGPGSISPVWTAGLDVSARPFFGDVAAAASSIGACVLAPPWRTVTACMVRSAHREGMRIVPWTVNQPVWMGRLIDLGVDGIVTDYPERLRAVMTQKQLAVPLPLTRPQLASARSA